MTADALTRAGWIRHGAELRPRLVLRPPVGALVARSRYAVERVARVGLLWQIVETWTAPAARRDRRR